MAALTAEAITIVYTLELGLLACGFYIGLGCWAWVRYEYFINKIIFYIKFIFNLEKKERKKKLCKFILHETYLNFSIYLTKAIELN